MVQPKERIKRRHVERGHVPAAANTIMDLVMDVFETTEFARPGARIPPVVAEGVEVGVRHQQQADVATERGQLVRQDGRDAVVLRLARRPVWIPDRRLVTPPLGLLSVDGMFLEE